MRKVHHQLKKIATGIEGFDQLAEGGLPENRAAVISCPLGSGKTIFGMEFLYKGITEFGENAVFMTFEEHPQDIKSEMADFFDWDIEKLEKEKKFVFVDANSVAEHQVEVGEYDMAVIADNILRMDFMREGQQVHRTITVEKSRASAHDENVKKYDITGSGVCILGDDGESCAIPQDKGGKSPKRRK